MPEEKHFLDSSVAQPMLLGTSAYKKYFEQQFSGHKIYISDYVEMEIKRSVIAHCIDFYFVLNMPNINDIGEALILWSHRFKGGEHKAVERLLGKMISDGRLRTFDPRDKSKALRILGYYIRRIEIVLKDKFINIGVNHARCKRAEVSFLAPEYEGLTLTEQLRYFKERFNDKEACRRACWIDRCILEKFRSDIDRYIKYAEELEKPKRGENEGFIDIISRLRNIIEKDGRGCTCDGCGKIGDAIIALEVPIDMNLEHTDFSFDHLCAVKKQAHRRHPSEIKFISDAQDSSSDSEA